MFEVSLALGAWGLEFLTGPSQHFLVVNAP
jgi:hypothetical protein